MKSQANKINEDSVAGTWSPLWSKWDGDSTPPEELSDVTLTFEGERCEVRRRGELIRSGTYSVNPENSPKTIDVCFTESDVPELIEAPLRGLYEVNLDELRICYGPPGGDRASSFCAEKGFSQYLAEYRRVAADADPTS